jgi:hypothetical protein
MAKKKLTVNEITDMYFSLIIEEGKSPEEAMKITGIKKVEEDSSGQVITIYYPDGEIISHWV